MTSAIAPSFQSPSKNSRVVTIATLNLLFPDSDKTHSGLATSKRDAMLLPRRENLSSHQKSFDLNRSLPIPSPRHAPSYSVFRKNSYQQVVATMRDEPVKQTATQIKAAQSLSRLQPTLIVAEKDLIHARPLSSRVRSQAYLTRFHTGYHHQPSLQRGKSDLSSQQQSNSFGYLPIFPKAMVDHNNNNQFEIFRKRTLTERAEECECDHMSAFCIVIFLSLGEDSNSNDDPAASRTVVNSTLTNDLHIPSISVQQPSGRKSNSRRRPYSFVLPSVAEYLDDE